MINFKSIFQRKAYVITVGKSEKEMLEGFIANKAEFEKWSSFQHNQRIHFQFYYPTALYFYFDDFHLFTAYFRKNAFYQVELRELKMTRANYSSICLSAWKPFEEVMVKFLNHLNENHHTIHLRTTKPLQEYAAICEELTINGKEPDYSGRPKSSVLLQ